MMYKANVAVCWDSYKALSVKLEFLNIKPGGT